MRILALETATELCSVAVVRDDTTDVVLSLRRPRAHAEHLVGLVERSLSLADTSLADLDAVAVSSGPGSYTGLRIGTSTAKGLCYAADLPLVAVPTLQAVAWSVTGFTGGRGIIATCLQSRREEVYFAVFAAGGHLPPDVLVDAKTATLDEAVQHITSAAGGARILLVGGGRNLEQLRGRLPGTPMAVPLYDTPYDAGWVGRFGRLRAEAGHLEDVAAFEPLYLKAFQARIAPPVFDRLPDMSGSRS